MEILKKIKKQIKKLMLKKGYKTSRHIVIFESDDWGAIRNPNKANFEKLKSIYPEHNFDHYQSLDTLENEEDINCLINVLKSHKDSLGQPAKFTLNFATANPNFEKIKADNCKEIYLEKITDSYSKGHNTQNVVESVNNGIKQNVLMPQLHSREHFNSKFLLDDIQNDKLVRDAFDLNIIGVAQDNYCALDSLNSSEEENKQLLFEAYKNFEDIFGFKSKTFIAPCYVWSDFDEKTLASLGVEGLQAKMFQNVPIERNKYKKVFRQFGATNKKSGLIYTARNCFFEPSRETWAHIDDNKIIENCLNEIEFAFACKKPAIVCSHRVNYVSNMSKINREHSLKLLDKLLTTLEKKYNDLEYMFSTELLNTLKEKNSD